MAGTALVSFTSYTMTYDATPAPSGAAPAPAAPLAPFVQRGDTASWQATFVDLFGNAIYPQSATLTIMVYGETVASIPMARSGEQWSASWQTPGNLGAPPVEWTVQSSGPVLTQSGTFQLY